MKTTTKLSKAQFDLLKSLLDGNRMVAPYYKPAEILVRLGLAKWSEKRLMVSSKLEITEAGTDLLQK